MIGKNSMKHHYLKKEDLYSHLNVEDITDADSTHTKAVFKNFLACMFKVLQNC